MIEYVLYLVGGYLVGSVPTAYLFVKATKGIDIRKTGSGNVGAYNAYEVTQSRLGGVLVGITDALKGFVVTYGSWQLFDASAWLQIMAFFGVILGHNYSPWLRFRGGRGLATAAGGYCGIGLTHIIVWCALWLVAYRFSKKILRANLYAILLSPIVVLILPSSVIEMLMIRDIGVMDFRLLVYIISTLHVLSHLDEIQKYILPKQNP